ncbi:MAG: carbon monoxide dehydrogenase subunit G [bacterium]|nr:carbon monoxide dehydrogenase subunit G [bacterium]
MRLEGEYRIDVPRDAVWEALFDAEILAGAMPGCEKLEQPEENTFEGLLNVQVGPVKGKYKGTLVLSDLVPPESYRMQLNGRGAAGFVTAEGDLYLVKDGAATTLHYEVEAQVGGRIAGVGQRLLDSSAKVITRQGMEGFERQLLARRETGGEEERAAPEAPSQAAFAARFAGGLLGELVPPRWRPWLVGGGLLVLVVVVALVIRSCV